MDVRHAPLTSETSATVSESRFVQLSTDWPRSSIAGYELASYTLEGDDLGRETLDAPSRGLFLGALSALLHRYTQQTTIAIDVRQLDASAGPAVWTPLDATVAGDLSVAAVAEGLGSSLRSSLSAGEPGAAPRQNGQESGQDSGAGAANVAVTFVRAGLGGTLVDASTLASGRADCDLHFIVPGAARPASLLIGYNARLFRAQTIERLARSFRVLLGAARADAATTVRTLPVLAPEEIGAVASAAEGLGLAPEALPVHRRFEALARTQPNAVACAFKDQRLTYGELEQRANRLAQHLRASGIERGVPVAVCLRPSTDVPVALLAIFKAGGVYLPLDPTHPEALLSMMLEEAQPRLVLTESALSRLTLPERFAQFCFDRDWERVEARPAEAPAGGGATLDHPSHLIYTSGTTGKPKGVLATQANLAYYIDSARAMYGFNAKDAFCALARYTFSISMFELLSPLCCGGSLRLLERDDVLSPERLASALDEVTVVHAGPSLLGSLFRHLRATGGAPRTFPRMRHASSGGDLVAPHVLEEMKQVFENAELFVIYGCTEVSCMGTTFPVSRDAPVTRSFVGKAFPGAVARVMDPDRNLCPFGVVGEIAFSGPGVVPGYLGRPELTAEKMIDIDGRRFYTTGDLGRMHPDGNIEILGRRDFQVQVRGIRVELPGIENTIRELGLAAQCAVVAERRDDGDVRLVAFVVGPRDTDVGVLRRTLATRLPDYMLPQSLVVLEALPLTANGKLDRHRLQSMTARPPALALAPPPPRDEAPGRSIELPIAAAFASALGVPAVGLDDDFFDRGGDSLLAVTLIQELENALGLSVSPGALFEHPTVRGLAAHLEGKLTTEPHPIALNRTGNAPALYMLLGVHIYRDLARRLDGQYAVHGVYAARELLMFESAERAPSVTELASDYVAIIRRQQPHGPYRVGGMSFGGIVAYEVAQQLGAAGEKVLFLGMLDAALPSRGLERVRRLAAVLPTRAGLRTVWARLRARARGVRAGANPAPSGDARAVGPLEEIRERSYHRAADDYVRRLRRFDGRTTLVVAGRRLLEDPLQNPTCGWEPSAPALDVHTVDADHLALLQEPKVSEVADIFLRALRRSEVPTAPPALRSVT